MGTLSNFFRRADGPPPPRRPAAPVTCRPAAREQVHAALRLLLSTGARLADEAAVVDFLRFAVQRGIDLNDLWVAAREDRVAWAALPITSPGRTMLLLVPPGERLRAADAGEDAAAALLEAVCDHFAGRGVQLAQALLDPADGASAQVFLRRGFRGMAVLQYLQADVRRAAPAPPPPLPDGFDWLTYAPDVHDTFVSTIVQSYRDSLDCPGLNGLREMEDVIAGHKASGAEFDPSWWFVLRERGEPRAVLLLARAAQPATTELVYLGLVPAARGRGLGDLVMRHALHVVGASAAATNEGRATLALAVDAHNVPALRLYHRHGMRRVGSKLAMVRDLGAGRATRDGEPAGATPDGPGRTTDAVV